MSIDTSPEIFGSVEGRTFISRAVIRQIEAGNDFECAGCEGTVKFAAKIRPKQVIANVYEDGIWQETKYYHDACYDEAGQPYGRPFTGEPIRTLEDQMVLDGLLNRNGQNGAKQ